MFSVSGIQMGLINKPIYTGNKPFQISNTRLFFNIHPLTSLFVQKFCIKTSK